MNEWLRELRPHNLLPGLMAGVAGSSLAITLAISYAAFVFSGPLGGQLYSGVGLALFGAAVLAGVTTLFSSYPGTVATVQDSPAVVLGLMAGAIAAGLPGGGGDPAFWPNMWAAIAISTLLTGACLFALGRFRLGGLVRFIPYPAVGGFLAAVGWLLVLGSFPVLTGLSLRMDTLALLLTADLWPRWAFSVGFAVLALVLQYRTNHPLLLPGLLLAAICVFFAGALLSGASLVEMQAKGWMLGPFPGVGIWHPPALADFFLLDWRLLAAQVPKLATLMLISVLALLLYASGIELTVRRDLDLNRELRAAGLANLLGGLGGGLPGYHSLPLSALSNQIGGSRRTVGLSICVQCASVLLFGTTLLSYFPRPVLGGLLLYMGLWFLWEQVYRGWHRLPKSEYAVVVLIWGVAAVFGYFTAILVGVLAASVLFAVDYSRIDVVRHALSGFTCRSNIDRPESAKQLLDVHGGSIFILKMNGFLFFGTAARLVSRVQERRQDTNQPPLRHVMLEFNHVSGLDSSAVISFLKLEQSAELEGFQISISGMRQEVWTLLRKGGFGQQYERRIHAFRDFYRGLEWCEDAVLAEAGWALRQEEAKPLQVHLAGEGFDPKAAADLMPYLRRHEVPPDRVLLRQGDPSDFLYFIESGRLLVQLRAEGGRQVRLRSFGPGAVVGEVALYLGLPRSASVVAQTDAVVFELNRGALARLEKEQPQVAAQLHAFVARMLSERLLNTTKLLEAVFE